MLSRLWQFTKRFRWPLVAALLTLVLLGYLLRPRPEVEYRLVVTSSETFPDYSVQTVQVSPSGKYLLQLGYEETMLQLYELNGMKLIFDHFPKFARRCGFNSDDELVFYSGDDDSFWCWKPGQTEPQKLCSHHVCSIDGEHRNHIEGAERCYHLNLSDACLLSSDARTWLIAVGDKGNRHFVLINARTGQERARLQLDAADMKKMQRVPLEAIFSPDSSVLLAQTQEPLRPDDETKEDIDLFWFDVQTGKKIRSKQLSYRLRMGDIGFFQDDRVFGISNIEEYDSLQTYSDAQGYRLFSLSETIAEPMEYPSPKVSDGVWRVRPQIGNRFDAASNTVVYWWHHALSPKVGAMSGGAPAIPGFYYSVRNLDTCKLIHSDRLPVRPRQSNDLYPEGWDMLEVLPGGVPLFRLSPVSSLFGFEAPSTWQGKWEAWREKHFSWFPVIFSEQSRLLFIQGSTGKWLTDLSLPFTEITCSFNQQQQALYLLGKTDNHVVLQKYSYPLHKPWLLVLSWSLGVFVMLASLQWIVHKLRHKKPNAI